MSAETRVVLAIASRLHMSAAAVEALSARELVAWVRFFQPEDDAQPIEVYSRDQLQALFNRGQ